jgi:hypothetical protein
LDVGERRELGIGDVVVPDMGCYSAGGSGPGLDDGNLRGEEERTVRTLERTQVAGGIGDGNCGAKPRSRLAFIAASISALAASHVTDAIGMALTICCKISSPAMR